jgi:hypothetical protein
MGSFYRSKHELILCFKAGTKSHTNNVELGRHGRNRTNVWEYAGVNTFRAGRLDELAMHPTVKPVALIADAIKDASRRSNVVLDPFCGSGSTLIATEKTGRHGYRPSATCGRRQVRSAATSNPRHLPALRIRFRSLRAKTHQRRSCSRGGASEAADGARRLP